MKHPRLVALALAAFSVSACCVALAIAGNAAKGAKTTASDDCCAHGAKATTASATCPATASCPAGSAQCTAAQKAACAKGAKAKPAAAGASCTAHGTAAAASAGSCTAAGAKSTMAAGTCTMHGAGKPDAAAAAHMDCVVCSDETACDEDVRGLNAHEQVVALRNGAMIVYTADTPENVRALQAAIARHNERIVGALATNSDASLCGGCKSFRGAMASGKFSRELVNVKNGAQVLLTSNDPAIVTRIHGLTGAQAPRVKS
jgi:hypothetical protein